MTRPGTCWLRPGAPPARRRRSCRAAAGSAAPASRRRWPPGGSGREVGAGGGGVGSGEHVGRLAAEGGQGTTRLGFKRAAGVGEGGGEGGRCVASGAWVRSPHGVLASRRPAGGTKRGSAAAATPGGCWWAPRTVSWPGFVARATPNAASADCGSGLVDAQGARVGGRAAKHVRAQPRCPSGILNDQSSSQRGAPGARWQRRAPC